MSAAMESHHHTEQNTSAMNQLRDIFKERDKLLNKCRTIAGSPRTIILIGRTRSGKSTIANVLRDPLYIPPTISVYSKTKTMEIVNIGSFEVVDLPGFFDRTSGANRGEQLSNDDINKLLDTYLQRATEVNLFGLVFSLTGGINAEDIESMLLVMKKYRKFSRNFALVITHCEHMNREEREKLVHDFFSNADVIKYGIEDFFKEGILCMGSCRHQSFIRNDIAAFEDQYQNVLEMRQEFIEKCRGSTTMNEKSCSDSDGYVYN